MVVLGGAAALLGWAVVPVAASAADMTLDPARFTTFAVPMPQLLTGLALGGLIGIPGIATSLVALATVGTWSRSLPAAAGALVGAVLGVLSCVVLSKVVTTATAGLASSRRFKDVSAVVFLIPLVLMGPIVAGIAEGIAGSGDFLTGLARTLSWTPAGCRVVPRRRPRRGQLRRRGPQVPDRRWPPSAGLALCWKVLLQRALVTPPYAGSSKKRAGGLGLFGLFPATPTGAVAARSLSYWLRDPRYAGSLVVVPLLPVLLLFQASQTGSYGLLAFVGPLTAFLLAWSISADVSYDNTAFALHLASGRARASTTGSAGPWRAWSSPCRWCWRFSVLPFLFGADWAAAARGARARPSASCSAGWGCPRWSRRATPSPCRCPGTAPSRSRRATWRRPWRCSSAAWACCWCWCSRKSRCVVAQFVTGSAVPGWINLVLGPVLGLALFAAGVRLGGKWLDARGPELLAQLAVNR